MHRIAIAGIVALSSACLYGQTVEEGFISCSAHSDCGEEQRCGGVVSSEDACLRDGYMGLADDGIFPERPEDQDSVFFQCDNGMSPFFASSASRRSVIAISVGHFMSTPPSSVGKV